MSNFKWAETDWHCWTMPLTGYPVSESGDYTPESGFHYQINHRNRDRFSVLDDDGVAELMQRLHDGAKLMRWRLQHFSDKHAGQLQELIGLGVLAEPDPSSIGLAMVAYRHWEQFGNLLVAEALMLHMFRMDYTKVEILNELYEEQTLCGESRHEGFTAFIDHCKIVLKYQRLNSRLPLKIGPEKKVKI